MNPGAAGGVSNAAATQSSSAASSAGAANSSGAANASHGSATLSETQQPTTQKGQIIDFAEERQKRGITSEMDDDFDDDHYRARREPPSEKELEEAQHQKDVESNKKALEVAGNIVGKVIPIVGAIMKAREVAKKIPVVNKALENAENDAVGKATKLQKQLPMGQEIQDKTNDANDDGSLDKANQVTSMIGGKGGGGNAGGAAQGAAASQGSSAPSSGSGSAPSSLGKSGGAESSNSSSPKQADIEIPEDAESIEMDDVPSSTDSSKGSDSKKSPLLGGGLKIFIFSGAFLFLLLIVIISDKTGGVIELSAGGNSSISTPAPGNQISSVAIEENLIYVGDSRTIGMQSALSNDKITYIGEISQGYEWFIQTGKPQLDNLLTNKQSKFVVLAFGINDLVNVDRYINVYNTLSSDSLNNKFYFLSVNPVDETKVSNITNIEIESFNEKLKNVFGENYIDTYTKIKDTFSTPDGVHYDQATYANIHGAVVQVLQKQNVFNGSISEYPTFNQSTELSVPLSTAIGADGIKQLEDYINTQISLGGSCSGQGVAGAGSGLIYGLHQQGYRIPYYWAGGHSSNNGVNPNWGGLTATSVSRSGTPYKYSGLDCSGFVSWAMNTAGVSGIHTASAFTELGTKTTFEAAAPGDLLANSGHVIMVIENKGSYLQTAEATSGGVQFKQYSKASTAIYSIRAMNDYYRAHCTLGGAA